MSRKLKKLIILAAVGGGLLLMCGGACTFLAVWAAPSLWGWVTSQAEWVAGLAPQARELVSAFAPQVDPALRDALNQMGQTTLEPAQLLGQLGAAGIPAAALSELSATEMNALLETWGVPVRVALPAAAAAGAGVLVGASALSAEGAAKDEKETIGSDPEEADEP